MSSITYSIPSFAPGGINLNNTTAFTWLIAKAYKLQSQKTLSRADKAVVKGPLEYTFRFLLPYTWTDTYSHTWQESKSPVQELAEKVVDMSRSYDQSGQIISGSVNAFTSLSKELEKSDSNGRSNPLKNINAAMKVGLNLDPDIPGYKVDTMLAFQGSSNRQWSFKFDVAFKSDRRKEIFEPIDALRKITSAEIDGEMSAIGIKFPYIFSLETSPDSGILKAENTAAAALVINWEGPYKNGYPAKADIDITFVEIEPLYRSNFINGTSVTSNDPGNEVKQAALNNANKNKGQTV